MYKNRVMQLLTVSVSFNIIIKRSDVEFVTNSHACDHEAWSCDRGCYFPVDKGVIIIM